MAPEHDQGIDEAKGLNGLLGSELAWQSTFDAGALLARLADAHADMVFVKDGGGRYLMVNAALVAFFGRTKADIIGRTDVDLMPPEAAARCHETDLEAMRNGRISVAEEEVDGRVYETRKFGIDLGVGGVAVGGLVRDVTEQRAASDRLAASEEKFRLAMEAARLGIYDWHVPSGGVYYSPGFADMLGCAQDVLEPTYAEWERRLHHEDRERVLAVMAELLRGDTDRFEAEHRLRSADGWIWVLERARVVERGADGSALRAVGTISDISTRRRAQADVLATSERLRRTVAGTVAALGTAVESKDPYTAGHERRVAELACAIAGQLGFEEEMIAGLNLAAMMHDVGKIAVPAEILSKPGRLSSMEMTLVRHHAQVGRDIIAGIEFDRPVADIVWQHHERLDGSGYPRGLKGDEILPEARVLAVADVVEAMMSHRPYRPALPIAEALDEIAAGAGTRYDAAVGAACRRLFLDERFVFTE